MSHIYYWNEKLEKKNIKLTFDFNTNLNEKQWFKGLKEKQIWIRIDQRTNENYFPSGNEWNKNIIACINAGIYLTKNKYIIPDMTDQIEIVKFMEKNVDLFEETMNEQSIKTKIWRKTPIQKESIEFFYSSLEVLLNEMDEGNEEHTNDVVKFFLSTLGINRRTSLFTTESRHPLKFNIAGVTCMTIPDVVVLYKDWASIALFDESKRRIKTSSFADFFSQVVCHSIAIGQNNMVHGKTQEIFGIAVKHTKWWFCHCIIPEKYLNALGDASPMSSKNFIIQKISKSPLDIINPEERKQIAMNILSILYYITSDKALIGDW